MYSVEVAQEMGLRPLARILGFADGEGEPPEFPTGKSNQMVDVGGQILHIFTLFRVVSSQGGHRQAVETDRTQGF